MPSSPIESFLQNLFFRSFAPSFSMLVNMVVCETAEWLKRVRPKKMHVLGVATLKQIVHFVLAVAVAVAEAVAIARLLGLFARLVGGGVIGPVQSSAQSRGSPSANQSRSAHQPTNQGQLISQPIKGNSSA
jgi:hypothetical protein